MTYIGSDNAQHRPFMIHRAILGSVERFFATLLEYHSGNLPLWLAPVQMVVLPITESQLDYARQIEERFNLAGLRCEVDARNEKIGYKIRDAEMKKVPFMCVIGKKEEESGTLTLRRHTAGDLGSMSYEDALKLVLDRP